jgi:peroxiredoxin
MAKIFLKLLLAAASGVLVSIAIAGPLSQGSPPPDFSLRSLDEENLRLSEYRSEVVILNFWAPWCGKCLEALQSLDALYADYREAGLQVLSVTVEGPPEDIREHLSGTGISFPVLTDDDYKSVSRMYDLGKLPLTLLIDREGNLRYRHAGLKKETNQQIVGQLEVLLSE